MKKPVEEILSLAIQMTASKQNIPAVLFIFFNNLENEIWIFVSLLHLGSRGSEHVKNKTVTRYSSCRQVS